MNVDFILGELAKEAGICVEGSNGHSKAAKLRAKHRRENIVNRAKQAIDFRPGSLLADVKEQTPDGNIKLVRYRFTKEGNRWFKEPIDKHSPKASCSKKEIPFTKATKNGTGMIFNNKNDRLPVNFVSSNMSKHDEQYGISDASSRNGVLIATMYPTDKSQRKRPAYVNINANRLKYKGSDIALNHELSHAYDYKNWRKDKNNPKGMYVSDNELFKKAINTAKANYKSRTGSDIKLNSHDSNSDEIFADVSAVKLTKGKNNTNRHLKYLNRINSTYNNKDQIRHRENISRKNMTDELLKIL